MTERGGWRALCGLLSLLGATGCASAPPLASAPIPSEQPPLLPQERAAAPAAVEPPAAPELELDEQRALLDEPWLAEVKTALAADKLLEAARAASRAREKLGAGHTDLGSASFLEGSLFERAKVPDLALGAYARVPASHVLAPFAKLRRVELLSSSGRHADAITEARELPGWSPASGAKDGAALSSERVDESAIVSFAARGDTAEIRAIAGRVLLDPKKRRRGFVDLGLRTVRALTNRPGVDFSELGVEIADALVLDAAKGKGADEALRARDTLLGRLPRERQGRIKSPSPAERVQRGQRLARSSQAKQALKLLDPLEKKLDQLDKASACTLARARAEALAELKRKSESYQASSAAVTRCAGQEQEIEVLLEAARSAAKAKVHSQAAAWFAQVEQRAPKSAHADDARVERAQAELAAGNTLVFRTLLRDIAKDYPAGDRTGDGLFALALEAMERAAWAEAKPTLETGVGLGPELLYTRAGRFSYYLGRAQAELGELAAARKSYEATLTGAPLSFYAALAAARLEQIVPGAASLTLTAAMGEKSPLPAALRVPTTAAEDPRVAAALLLSSLGDARSTSDALGALGVLDRRAEPRIILLGARLLARAGDAQGAHALLRTARERGSSATRNEVAELASELPRPALRSAYELAFPRLFRTEVAAASAESQVPEWKLYAVMREESAFLPKVVSVANARGLMQVIPATGSRGARSLGIKYDELTLFDPSHNTRIGARFYAQLEKRFAFAPVLAIPGYNAGPGAPERWLEERPAWDFDLWAENIPYTETRNYLKRVWSTAFVYRVLYGPPGLGELTAVPKILPPPAP